VEHVRGFTSPSSGCVFLVINSRGGHTNWRQLHAVYLCNLCWLLAVACLHFLPCHTVEVSFLFTCVMVRKEAVASDHYIVYGIQHYMPNSVTPLFMKPICRFHYLGIDDIRKLTSSANL